MVEDRESTREAQRSGEIDRGTGHGRHGVAVRVTGQIGRRQTRLVPGRRAAPTVKPLVRQGDRGLGGVPGGEARGRETPHDGRGFVADHCCGIDHLLGAGEHHMQVGGGYRPGFTGEIDPLPESDQPTGPELRADHLVGHAGRAQQGTCDRLGGECPWLGGAHPPIVATRARAWGGCAQGPWVREWCRRAACQEISGISGHLPLARWTTPKFAGIRAAILAPYARELRDVRI